MENSKKTIFINTDDIDIQEKKILSDYTRRFVYKVAKYSKDILGNYNSSDTWSSYTSFENNYYLDFLESEIWNVLILIDINTSKDDMILIYSKIEEKIWGFLKKYLKISSFSLWNDIKKNMLESLPYNSNNNFINFLKNEFSQELSKVIKKIVDIDINIPIIGNDYILPNMTNDGILIAYQDNGKIKFKYEYNKATEESSLINSTINKEILESDKIAIRLRIAKVNNTKSDILNIIDYLKVSKNETFLSIFDEDIFDMFNNVIKFFDDFDSELKYYNENFYLNYFKDLIYYIKSHEINWTLYKFNEDFIKEKSMQLEGDFYKTLQGNINQIFNNIAKEIAGKRYINKEENAKELLLKKENNEKTILKKEELKSLQKIIHSFIRVINLNSDKTINEIKQQEIFTSFDEMLKILKNNNVFESSIYSRYFENLLDFYRRNDTLTLDDYNDIYQKQLEEIIEGFPKDSLDNKNYIVIKSISRQFEDKAKFNFDLLGSLENDINIEIKKIDSIIN